MRGSYEDSYRGGDAPRPRSPYRGDYDDGRFANDVYYDDKVCLPPSDMSDNRSGWLNYVQKVMLVNETGEGDLSKDGEPIKFVLVRGLKPSTPESLFAKGMEKFYKGLDELEGGADENSLKRVFLVRERTTDHSLGFGFAEYHSIRDAQGAVEKQYKLTRAKKCTIGSNEITLNFPHKGVFPLASFGRHDHDERFRFTLAGQQHKYHDDRFYAAELLVNAEPPKQAISVDAKKSAEEKDATKAGIKRGIETLESKAKKVKKSTTTSTPAVLGLWGRKQAELRGEPEKPEVAQPKQPLSGANTITATAPDNSNDEEIQTFAHEGQVLGCYLCGSEFTSKDHLMKHLQQSKLHVSNLKDKKVVERAYKRLKEKAIDPADTVKLPKPPAKPQTGLEDDASNKYRDRAAERREETKTIGFSLKGAGAREKKAGNTSGPSSDSEASKPTYGKGMNMLQKAGWSEGQSLGAGEGIKAPISQDMYASGVGLGHENSKQGDAVEEASRMTKSDRGGFLEKTKELAKKRYEQME